MGERKRWPRRDITREIEQIAWVLKEEGAVRGVAATGSFSRFEFPCGDIDVVIFHDGRLPDGSASYPSKTYGYYSNPAIALDNALSPRAFRELPKHIPTDYMFVREDALWNCAYLQSLKEIERFADFYLRILTDPENPLVLFRANDSLGALGRFLKNDPCFDEKLSDWFRVRHVCTDPKCKPKKPWSQERLEMEARKLKI